MDGGNGIEAVYQQYRYLTNCKGSIQNLSMTKGNFDDGVLESGDTLVEFDSEVFDLIEESDRFVIDLE